MKKGRCRICGEIRELTFDHIPPRGTVRSDDLDVRDLAQYLSCSPTKPRRAFRSVEFRTLCTECNSSRLGAQYDPSLVDLCNAAATWIRSQYQLRLTLPPTFKVHTKPGRVARAIIGHLLAVDSRRDRTAPLVEAPMPKAMREYFLNAELPLPDDLEIFCWPYPSDRQIVVRASGIAKSGNIGVVVGDFIKFFPLAWWVTFTRPTEVSVNMCQIPTHHSLDDECILEINLSSVPPVDWPEEPAQDGILLFNSNISSIAMPRKKE